MRMHTLTPTQWWKALGVGIVTALLLSAVMVPAMRMGISPMPQPLGLAFASTLLGPVPLPVGLLFHIIYVTAWSLFFVVMFRDSMSFTHSGLLALVLWVLVLVVFFPFVGWGFLGLGIGPQLIVGSFVPHLLFAFFLWGLTRIAF